jgi:hypothetical protein
MRAWEIEFFYRGYSGMQRTFAIHDLRFAIADEVAPQIANQAKPRAGSPVSTETFRPERGKGCRSPSSVAAATSSG